MLGDVIALVASVATVIIEGGFDPLMIIKLVASVMKVVEKLAHPSCSL